MNKNMLSIPKFDIANSEHYQKLSSTVQKLDYCDTQLASFRRTGLYSQSSGKNYQEGYWDHERDVQLQTYDQEFGEILERLHKKSILWQDTGYYLDHLYAKENPRLKQGARFGYWSSRAYMLCGLISFLSACVIAIYNYHIASHLNRSDILNVSFCLVAGVLFFIGAWCLNVWLLVLMRQVKIDDSNVQTSETETHDYSDAFSFRPGSASEYDSLSDFSINKINLKVNEHEDPGGCCSIS